jgi:sugar O-acyltransferase (sialic acid O-acetyltransferase NeuD family)
MKNILLYGASGHSKVICSILESMDVSIDAIFDDNQNIITLNQYRVINKYDEMYNSNFPIIIAIGNNQVRKNISKKIMHNYSIAIHKSVILDKSVKVDIGSVIMHNATIQSDTIIGKHCIVNTNSTIDHDCTLKDFVHISPSATLCGNVTVEEGTHVGAGATVIPNIKIGKWCIIGAGAVITKNIPDYSLVVGIPGTIIKKLNHE